ncbi:MAG: dihydrofolate reductase family protein [Candidatus Dormibacter sp.]|uniref:dihydrofolate reductase family protein n=1 Tax=Candidatus Dormibacter sp. TaxID=2973982 RepID=UPI000DB0B549|nr:MAG: riboflavin biosynthesis protein RibD [Candidatus Dormibacteraeota bacterium]
MQMNMVQQDAPARRIFSFMVATLDGYYEGPNRDFDWPVVDEEFNEFALQQLNEVDTILFGRVTYSLMAQWWPTDAAKEADPVVASKMNGLPKIVVSRTLEQADWANTRLVKDDVADELARLKRQPGKDMVIMGSSNLTVSLLGMGIVDELRVMVNPVILGGGQSLFRTATERIGVKLRKARSFRSGNVLLHYQPMRKEA